jgi:WD40 repeat protein/energy-coupling factor transporter ATP-binding protein EcfA2
VTGGQPDLFSSSLINFYVDEDPRFVARPWLLKRIESALDEKDGRFVLLTGPPGSGKTALLANLARLHPDAPRYFIRRDSQTPLRGGDARTFLFAVGHQLAHTHPGVFHSDRLEVLVRQRAERIEGRMVAIEVGDLRASPFRDTAIQVEQHGGLAQGEIVGISAARMTLEPRLLELSNLQYLALLDPAEALAKEEPESRILVLVDALDEIRFSPSGEDILDWLTTCPALPPNVRFVLTSRADDDLLGMFRRSKAPELVELSIDPDSEEDRVLISEDVRRYLQGFTSEPAVAESLETYRVPPSFLVKEATDKAEGNFQYLVALARGIDAGLSRQPPAENLPALLRLEGIPRGTEELYRFFLAKIKEQADRASVRFALGPLEEPEDRPAWEILYHPVLAVLSVAFEPLSTDQIQRYSAAPAEGMPRALANLEQFLDRLPDGRYRLYHSTFPEFLTGNATKSPTDPFHVDPFAWHGRIAGRLIRGNRDWLSSTDGYALAHAAAHLTEAITLSIDKVGKEELTSALTGLVTDFGFLEKKTDAIGIESTVADLMLARRAGVDGPLADLHRVLALETHRLRDWDWESRPAYFAQQVLTRATSLTLESLAAAAKERIQRLGRPYLDLVWWSGQGSGALERILTGHGAAYAVAAGPDRMAVSGYGDGSIKVWDLETGEQIKTLSYPEFLKGSRAAHAVAVIPDGRSAISGSSAGVEVWDLRLGTHVKTLVGHGEQVNAVAVSPDGRLVVSGSRDKTLKVWDLESGEDLRTLSGHREEVRAVAVSPDGRLVVSGSRDTTVKVWDLESGEDLRTLSGHGAPVTAVAVTPDGRLVVSGSGDKTLKVWDLKTGDNLRTLTGHEDTIFAVAVPPGGRRAVSGSRDKTLRVWDLQTGEEVGVLGAHSWEITSVAVASDGSRVVSGGWPDKDLKVWDLARVGNSGPTTGHSEPVNAVAVTDDGRWVITGSADRTIKVWDIESGAEIGTLTGHRDGVRAVAVSPDGRLVLSLSRDGTYGRFIVSGDENTTLKSWDLETGRELSSDSFPGDKISTVTLAPDGRRAVFGSATPTKKTIRLASGRLTTVDVEKAMVLELETGRVLGALRGHWVVDLPVAITSDGSLALFGSERSMTQGLIKVWNLDTGHEATTLIAGREGVQAVAVTPDGHRAISGSADRTIGVWDLESGENLKTLVGHGEQVNAVAVSPDGRLVVSGSRDKTLKVWDLESGEDLRTLSGHGARVYQVAVSPDGRLVVSGSMDKTVKVWDLESGEDLRTLSGHGAPVTAVAVTPDGRLVVSGSGDNTLKVWDLESGEDLRTLSGHGEPVTTVAVTPDGRLLLSGSWDKTVRVWDLETGEKLWTLTHSAPLVGVAAKRDDRRAVSASSDGTVKVWNLETGEDLRAGIPRLGDCTSMAVTLDGRVLLGSDELRHEGLVMVTSLETGDDLGTIGRHDRRVRALAVTPDGRRAVSGSVDGEVKAGNLGPGENLSTLGRHPGSVQAVAVTPDGRRAVSASEDGTISMWDLDMRRAVVSTAAPEGLRDCAFVADSGAILAGGTPHNLWCFRLVEWPTDSDRR